MADDFKSRLDAAQKTYREKHVPHATPSEEQEIKNRNLGFRAGGELIVHIFAGGLLGYGIDRYFEIAPWGLIGMLLLGVASGFMAVYRVMNKFDSAIGFVQLHNPEKTGSNAREQDGVAPSEDHRE